MTRTPQVLRRAVFSVFALSLAVAPLFSLQAQGNNAAAQIAADKALLAKETYQMPPEAIAKLVLAPRHLNVSLSAPSLAQHVPSWAIRPS